MNYDAELKVILLLVTYRALEEAAFWGCCVICLNCFKAKTTSVVVLFALQSGFDPLHKFTTSLKQKLHPIITVNFFNASSLIKVLLWSKNNFLLFFRFWKRVRLTPEWENFELWFLSKGCPSKGLDFTVRRYSRSKMTDWTSEGWIYGKVTSLLKISACKCN